MYQEFKAAETTQNNVVALRNGRNPLGDATEIRQALKTILKPGQVFEIRILKGKTQRNSYRPNTYAGYFQNTDESINLLIQQLRQFTEYMGVYFTPQACNGQLLHRIYQELLVQDKDFSTSNKEMLGYQWLFVDSDPVRLSDISATEEEHQLAFDKGKQVKEYLLSVGFSQPFEGDSGNGHHQGYRIEAPNEPEFAHKDTGLIPRVLRALSEKFSDDYVKIDVSVGNPARIWKLYGTMACKGSNTPVRPHRLAHLIQVPDVLEVTPLTLLESIAQPLPVETPSQPTQRTQRSTPSSDEPFVETFLTRNAVPWRLETSADYSKYILTNGCVFDPSHRGNDAAIIMLPNGALKYNCFHDSCDGMKWEDFAKHVEPGYQTSKEKNAAYEATQAAKKTKASKQKVKQEEDVTQEDAEEKAPKEPPAQYKLMDIAKNAKLICTPSGALYARVPVNGHHEIVSVNESGSGFRRWLVYKFHQQEGFIPNSDALSLVMSGIQASATYEGERAQVYTRIAERNGCVYLDLCNDKWQCVEISKDGWRVITCPPVYFRRPNGMLPLPIPQRGGTLNELRKIIHAKDEKDYILMDAWLVGTLHPTGPYAALNLNGERGSAKSFTSRILRTVVDPNTAPLRNVPKDDREAAIAAQNNMVIVLDNLSTMNMWLSDILCRTATGSGFATKKNYTDDEEQVFNASRPIIMNGIADGIISQADLLNRTIMVTLQPPDVYRPEEEINEEFIEMHPKILGAVLTACATALRYRKTVELDTTPRMVDFARWVTAAEPALGWKPGTFLEVFAENQDNSTSIVTEASPVAKAIVQFMANHPKGWEGLISELHTELQHYEFYEKAKSAPKIANQLSGQLKRVAPALRSQGIQVEIPPRRKTGSYVVLSFIPGVDDPESGVDGVDRKKASTPPSTPPVKRHAEPDEMAHKNAGVDGVDDLPLNPENRKKEESKKRERLDKVVNPSTPSTPDSSDYSTGGANSGVDGIWASTPSTPPSTPDYAEYLKTFSVGQLVSTPDGWGNITRLSPMSMDIDSMGRSLHYTGTRILMVSAK